MAFSNDRQYKYQEHIKLGEIIYNTYSLHKANYFNVKNMYNLMIIYYNNDEIYNNVVVKYINNSKNRDNLKILLEQKKNHKNLFNENKMINNFNQNNNFISNNISINLNNQIINQTNNKVIKNNSIKEDFCSPPLIGLESVNDTSYMNAILQCLSQIEKLTNYFKYTDRIDEIIQKYKQKGILCLTESYKILIEHLWPSNYDYISKKNYRRNNNNHNYSSYEFKQKILNMNPLFKSAAANDAKDLVNFIIMTLHEELNKAKKNNSLYIYATQLDQTNQMKIFNSFFQNFVNKNQSIISDLFYGVNSTHTQCSQCKTTKYNFQTYFFLVFPIEEIRNYKIQQLQNNIMNNNNLNMMNMNQNMIHQQNILKFQNNFQNINSININDCFDYNQKMEYLIGENSLYCNYCKNQLTACYQTFLFSCPEILILILNRITGIELNVNVEFPEHLNLYNYISRKETGYMYFLIGVVTFFNGSGENNHFISYCKSPIDYKWYKYNDDLVTEVINFKQEIIDDTIPYILLYQKNENNF